ncbi:hypothetical protein LSTR_LSTR013348 [Laodelphax striatellus]|uniref:Uncharacterized protein n=1 Tax=Laodelphax striatellus TaxID=195883 RepID=A0A482XAP6_LAOST|nr:hypothetical protein LSTR_LSTR013348 [Laodelphax striatellus]
MVLNRFEIEEHSKTLSRVRLRSQTDCSLEDSERNNVGTSLNHGTSTMPRLQESVTAALLTRADVQNQKRTKFTCTTAQLENNVLSAKNAPPANKPHR